MFEKFERSVCEVFKEAEMQKKLLQHEYVGTEHLLLAILKNDSDACKELNRFNINYNNFYREVKLSLPPALNDDDLNIYTPLLKRVINSASKKERVNEKDLLFYILDEGEGVAIRILISMGVDVDLLYNNLKNNKNLVCDLELSKYGKILNETIDINEKVIGREKEIDLLIETLLRKKKNNPLLIGDAGVGKSAIVEEFVRRIIKGDVPNALINSKVVCLEMGTLISGTRYRGEFEERLTKILKEAISNPDIILFIDEIHSMVNAGAAEGAISASDILKPALARGEIKCIGATTKKEYEKHMLGDKALSRRFDPILVQEPNENATFEILSRIKDEYINYHNVNITDETIKNLIHLAAVYFPNLKNPDKSLELLDSVMAYVRLKDTSETVKEKENQLNNITLNKYREIENGNFKEALKNNIAENKLKKELKYIKNGQRKMVKNSDVIDMLEFKNNIFICKDRVKYVSRELKNKYDNKAIDIIISTLKKNNRPSCFVINGEKTNIVDDLAKALKFQIIKIKDDNFEKVFNEVKYYPSSIIVTTESNNCKINDLLKKIIKDGLVEYQNEYINFNNTLIIINSEMESVGFKDTFISDVPIDEVITFRQEIKN